MVGLVEVRQGRRQIRVQTKMSETAARARKNNPIAWDCLAVLQRAIYRDTLCRRLSVIAVA